MGHHVVLVGGGHAHLFVVSQAESFRSAGVELSLVDPGMLWYSGMATGMLGGMYTPDQDRVDLKALCRRYQVKFYPTKAVALDPKAKTLQTASGEALTYDRLSLDVGSVVDRNGMHDPDDVAWAVKPIAGLIELQAALRAYGREGRSCAIGVIGGGPTGAEIAANIQAFCKRTGGQSSLMLVHGGERLLSGFSRKAAETLTRILDQRGIDIRLGTRVAKLHRLGSKIIAGTTDGREFTFDEVVLATGLVPSPSVAALGLGENGLTVNKWLYSLEHESIFGAGDCIAFTERALPKVGVFSVREAPVLKANLLASLSGECLEPYEPQEKFLIILNLGDGTGLAIRGNWHWHGRLAFFLKNIIDTRFMKQYQRLHC